MYQNIGKKIKGIAKFYAWMGVFFSVVYAAIIMIGGVPDVQIGMTGRIIAGIVVLAMGSLIAWISSWLVYGFGELIENVKKIADKN
ncbi:MAG: hypothetical protein RSD95_12670 [Clostridia bacterium]